MKRFAIKPIAAACAIALGVASPLALAGKDKGGSSDVWAEASLTTTYTLNRHLNPFKIDTDVKNGVATLRGSVDSQVEKDLAEELALGVDGIKKVRNELKIVPDDDHRTAQRDDADVKDGEHRSFMQTVEDANLTAKVKSQLLWNSNTSGLAIDVDTRNAMVTLKGSVDSQAEAQLAEQIAKNTSDVRGVNNQLQVKGLPATAAGQIKQDAKAAGEAVSDGWITTKVKSALIYNRSVDGSDIDVDVKDGVVTLRGHIDSDYEGKQAVNIAQGIKGVKSVKSELKSS